MTEEKLRWLINQPESPSLEFKQELNIFILDKESQPRHRDEFIRDVLSLANGNTTTAGEYAYLVIGVEDLIDPDRGRTVCGIAGKIPSRSEILSIIRPASDPPLDDILCETFEIDAKIVFVITILPSPHIYETKRGLQTIKRSYSEHIVFIRSGDSINIANAKERAALQDVKQFRYNESHKANPTALGGIVGIIVGGSVANGLLKRSEQPALQNSIVVGIYTLISGLFGAFLGNGYKSIKEFQSELQFIPRERRILVSSGILAVSYGAVFFVYKLIGRLLTVLSAKYVTKSISE